MSTKDNNGAGSDWRSRVHELNFPRNQLQKIETAVVTDKRSILDVLLDLAVDNCSIKIKSVEYYSSYTFSYTLDKNHPTHGSHTFWFYDTDMGRGVRVMSHFALEMLDDYLSEKTMYKQSGLW